MDLEDLINPSWTVPFGPSSFAFATELLTFLVEASFALALEKVLQSLLLDSLRSRFFLVW